MHRWLLIIPLLCLFTSLSRAEVVSVASGEWPPYVSEQLEHGGVISHLISAAFAAVDIDVEYHYYPWNRSLNLVRAGAHDATPVWSWTEQREQQFLFSHSPIGIEQSVFFFRKSHPVTWQQIWSPQPGEVIRIGATLGYSYGPEFQEHVQDEHFRLRRSHSDTEGLRLLLDGHIDAFPISRQVSEQLLALHFTASERNRLATVARPLREIDLHLLFSRATQNGEQLREKFEAGLRIIEANGTRAAIVEQHQFDPLISTP
ncbi:amino acid ABC transporter substrate-binding protein [Bacterioplanes sanyensis]|uniref:Amino acid ABC transporter substrate-binding protein n=1 Tax=Bacterioplanes sanyensis TaxID=1249553 RepID=A0A222FJ04_9GAMM|nr:transporter substrate-binding domain-containing protein [Bacterioplanes sanyensis]ASP38401.1 amino acid ABC transporter substrate-binding protein [Bacterioplanes sanyensis]